MTNKLVIYWHKVTDQEDVVWYQASNSARPLVRKLTDYPDAWICMGDLVAKYTEVTIIRKEWDLVMTITKRELQEN